MTKKKRVPSDTNVQTPGLHTSENGTENRPISSETLCLLKHTLIAARPAASAFVFSTFWGTRPTPSKSCSKKCRVESAVTWFEKLRQLTRK